jgi:hypothetical protein
MVVAETGGPFTFRCLDVQVPSNYSYCGEVHVEMYLQAKSVSLLSLITVFGILEHVTQD